MNRLIVNPNQPDSWEIQLKEGANHLGRGKDTDFQITHASVSNSHCIISVADGDVTIQDLGSTNGTFINGEAVHTAKLSDGQNLRLGSVEMAFHADAPAPAANVNPAAEPGKTRLRVAGLTHAEPEAAADIAELPPPLQPAFDLSAASKFCKYHPKNFARWVCSKCQRSFCDLCVNFHTVSGIENGLCRACAVACVPLEMEESSTPSQASFLRGLPGTFIYPFRGMGLLMLIASTIVISALSFFRIGIFGILMKIIAIGYLFSFMQNIIHATANEEDEMPELPGMDDVFGGFLRLAGTVVMSFGLPIAMLVARFFDVEIPVSAILITALLGCIYFPMAFLAVAITDNVMSSNPMIVLPSIVRVFGQYVVTVIIFASIFGVQQIGNLVSAGAASVTFTTTDTSVFLMSIGYRLVWSFISVYLLTVNMRILGLLYATQREKLGWV